jgi:GH43 family beta-xylosidase
MAGSTLTSSPGTDPAFDSPMAFAPIRLTRCQCAPNKSPRREPRFEVLERRTLLSGDGLAAQYFHNPDFTGLAFERAEAVDFNWGTGAPAPGVSPDTFSVRWVGQVEAKYTETYTFRTVSDDGVRLWVDGQLLVDNWTNHTAQANTGTIALTAGKRYDIRLEYYDNANSALIRLQWASPSQPQEVIPAEQLSTAPQGLRGEYSDTAGHSSTRTDQSIDFNWGVISPALNINPDNYKVRWTGYLRPDFSETYTFTTLSDEGVRVWVGNELIIDNFTPHAVATDACAKTLEAGKLYDIRDEYFEGTGPAEMHLSWSSDRQTAGQSQVITAANLLAAKATPLTFTNPLGQGQDPWVAQAGGYYYYAYSSGNGVNITRAAQLQDIETSSTHNTTVRAWSAPSGQPYSTMVWAPELHQINGKWYIYVAAASNNDNSTHRMYVLERDAADPMGPFTFKGQLNTNGWAIDGTAFQWQNQLYFVWSGWPGGTDGQQNLYIASMGDPLTLSSGRAIISTPNYSWEKNGLPINEGPEALIHNGTLSIIYSASGYWTSDYALGRITYDGSGSLLTASNWAKAPSPVFAKTSEIVGVGHASFVQSPDGTEDWIVYHSHPSPGGDPDARVVHIQPFTWFADNTPNFGPPISNSVMLEAPSGYADADRPLVEGDYDASGAVNSLDLNVFKGQFGLALTPGISADAVADGLIDGADFLRWQQQLGATHTTPAAILNLAPGEPPGANADPLTSPNNAPPQPASAAASLDAVFSANDFTTLFATSPTAYRPERRSRFWF